MSLRKIDENMIDDKFTKKVKDIDTKTQELSASLADKANQSDIEEFNRRVDEIITTPAEGISEQEIIDARNGAQSLGDNIRQIDNKIENFADLELTNLIKNGSFENGLVNWQSLGAVTTEDGAGLTGNRAAYVSPQSSTHLYQPISSAKGDILYLRSWIKPVQMGDIGAIYMGLSSRSLNEVYRSVFLPKESVNNWTPVSFNVKTIVNDPAVTFFFKTANTVRALGYIDGVLAINLTKTFGAGKEPTAEEMDEILKEYTYSWFDGVRQIGTKSSRFLFDKTNKNRIEGKDGKPVLLVKEKVSNLTIDSEAHKDLTFNDLFVKRNKITNSHFNNGLINFTVVAGSPAITSEVYNTPSQSLKAVGTSSQHVRVALSLPGKRKYFIAAKIRVDRWVAGGAGFQALVDNVGVVRELKHVTSGFVTLAEEFVKPTDNPMTILVGTTSSANADVYIDDFVILDITDIEINTAQLEYLYEIYLSIVKNQSPTATIIKAYNLAIQEDRQDFQGASTILDRDENKTVIYQAEKKNNEITFNWETQENSVNLNSIAYGNVTFKQMFEDRNFIANSHFDRGLEGYSIGFGNPHISNEAYNTPSQSLKTFGNTSNYLSIPSRPSVGAKFYVAAKVKVNRYVSGAVGFQFSRSVTSGKSRTAGYVTDGFVTISDIILNDADAPIGSIVLGSFNGANLDAYIDDFVIVDISDLENESEVELDRLYDQYLRMKKGESTAVTVNKSYKIATLDTTPVNNEDAARAFTRAMNEKAKEIGMNNSAFINPFGGDNSLEQYVTASDLIQLGVHAMGYDELVKIWNLKSYVISIKGSNARKYTVISTVENAALEDHYFIFGGKTGSTKVLNLLVLVNAPDGNIFVGAVLGASGNRFEVAKNLFDIGKLKMSGDTGTHDVNASQAAVALMPKHNPFAYDKFKIPLLFGKDEDTKQYPASVTKLLTSVVALNYISDMNDTLEITQADIVDIGAGLVLQPGDIITYRDAIAGMMLPSSNTSAKAIARTIGAKILRNTH